MRDRNWSIVNPYFRNLVPAGLPRNFYYFCFKELKDKRFKNPNRQCEKRQKSQILKDMHEDMNFAEEMISDVVTSVENSPRLKESPQFTNNCFNEITGRFPNDDSFEIVFTDEPVFNRSRKVSDCESEDSFIVFEDSPDNCYTSTDVFGDCDFSDSEESCNSESEDETCNLPHSLSRSLGDLTDLSLYEVDQVDHAFVQTAVDEIEPQTAVTDKQSGLLLTEAKKQCRKHLSPKKVQFSDRPPEVHVMRVWAFAASQARIGHWEQFARDRDRFKRRIADVDMAISWVLKPQHRSRVMFQRFMPWWNAEKRREQAEKKILEEKAGRPENVAVSVEDSVNDLVNDTIVNDKIVNDTMVSNTVGNETMINDDTGLDVESANDTSKQEYEIKEIRLENFKNKDFIYKDVIVDEKMCIVDDFKLKLNEIDLENVRNINNRLKDSVVNT